MIRTRLQPPLSLASIMSIEIFESRKKADNIVRYSGMDQIQVEGGDRCTVENSRNTANNNEIHPVFGKSAQKCQKIRCGKHHCTISQGT